MVISALKILAVRSTEVMVDSSPSSEDWLQLEIAQIYLPVLCIF